MFAEPQSVTVAGAAHSLPRVASGDRKGVFATSTGDYVLTVSHDLKSRNRRNVRLDSTKTAADPLVSGVNRQYSMSAYVVIDHPKVGFSNTEIKDLLKALTDFLGTAGVSDKIVGGES
jgi:hypothetical protein